jgi:hypothetical protein
MTFSRQSRTSAAKDKLPEQGEKSNFEEAVSDLTSIYKASIFKASIVVCDASTPSKEASAQAEETFVGPPFPFLGLAAGMFAVFSILSYSELRVLRAQGASLRISCYLALCIEENRLQ